MNRPLPRSTPLLFTPGPLTTSDAVRAAMTVDVGSRDRAFIHTVRFIRDELLAVAGVAPERWTAVPVQGSGTFAVEAAIGTLIPAGAKLLVAVNGAYGRRIVQIAEVLGIAVATVDAAEHEPIDPAAVDRALAADPAIRFVAVVHCETTSGLLNPIATIGPLARARGCTVIVDAMSSFAGIPLDVEGAAIDVLVASSNKCVQGTPGFGFVLARTALLAASAGQARSLSLDLHAQWRGLEQDGQFRFTPPTQVLLAFAQALRELAAEGGVAARSRRYAANHAALVEGMALRGFRLFVRPEHRGPIITTFYYPRDPRFEFAAFYAGLAARGCVIYPGKVGHADVFRIGNIGDLHVEAIARLLAAIDEVLVELGVPNPVP